MQEVIFFKFITRFQHFNQWALVKRLAIPFTICCQDLVAMRLVLNPLEKKLILNGQAL